MVSERTRINTAINMWIVTHAENVFFNKLSLSVPKANVKCLEVAFAIAVFIKLNITTIPPTTLFKPKSTSPNVLIMTLEVNNPTIIDINILMYSIRVFLAIRLLFAAVFPIYYC